ncbi:MAG TPA: hypothetical protein PLL65_19250 [Phycisphaerae bacterium]|nr:hypothetical protein [Phycisphaerae bacterium]
MAKNALRSAVSSVGNMILLLCVLVGLVGIAVGIWKQEAELILAGVGVMISAYPFALLFSAHELLGELVDLQTAANRQAAIAATQSAATTPAAARPAVPVAPAEPAATVPQFLVRGFDASGKAVKMKVFASDEKEATVRARAKMAAVSCVNQIA